MSLELLSKPTQEKLRSTQLLTSFPQIISELLQNALDARATTVEIGVDIEGWECWVRDDGEGISRDGLKAISSGRYHTSKVYSPASIDTASAFGFRGEAIPSAASVSCLEIVSRTSRSKESWTVIVKDGKCLYDGHSTRWRRDRPGTVVCLRDIFYNLPVRRTTHTPPAKTLELIRREVEIFALVFPEVSFSLDDISRVRSGLDGRIMSIKKTNSSLAAFRNIYGRALCEHADEISIRQGHMVLSGFISIDGTLSKNHEYMYINKHPIAPCHLHRTVESLFANSTYGHIASDENRFVLSPRQSSRIRRRAERKPTYLLNITVPTQEVDRCLDPAKTVVHLMNDVNVTEFLALTIRSFLVRHGFSSPASIQPLSPSPSRKRRRIEITLSHDPTSSVSGHHNAQLPRPREKNDHRTDALSNLETNLTGLIIHPGEEDKDTTGNREYIIWNDPRTGARYYIDQRTGNSYPEDVMQQRAEGEAEGYSRPTTAGRRTLRLDDWAGFRRDADTPEWLARALNTNLAYRALEQQIPSLPPTQNQDRAILRPCMPSHHHTNVQKTTFGRVNLTHATVLAQVDRKFLLCSLPGGTLLLFDQHAASERIRVERFLREMCEGYLADNEAEHARTEVIPVAPVLLSAREAEMMKEGSAAQWALVKWGFRFAASRTHSVQPDMVDEQHAQVYVSSVPSAVAQKLLLPNELEIFLKGYLAEWDADQVLPPTASQVDKESPDDAFPWQRAMRFCPRGLIELANSRACRGAIMFNDALTRAQCQRLVVQLAQTAFPFQCAHGRPSLVPLANISTPAGRREVRVKPVDWEHFRRTVTLQETCEPE